jgi:hypothetical protein
VIPHTPSAAAPADTNELHLRWESTLVRGCDFVCGRYPGPNRTVLTAEIHPSGVVPHEGAGGWRRAVRNVCGWSLLPS